MEYREKMQAWLNDPCIDEASKAEIRAIDDEQELEDRFYKELEFGTAGLRGILGAGTNRMNRYVIARASQGLADTILAEGPAAAKKGIVIAHDVRHGSELFTKIAAEVFAANGIKTYVFKDICPTPMLSYGVRYLGTQSGIVITASHNPKNYNGYKVYWDKGSQILSDVADRIQEAIAALAFKDVKSLDFEKGLDAGIIEYCPEALDQAYYHATLIRALREDVDKSIKVVYTPLNGTGNKPVRHVLAERGFESIHVVAEQENPDPDFTTVGYPNPEDVKAFKYAEALGDELGAELLLATDPDCDRVSMEVRHDGKYVSFTGNQIGSLLAHYILSSLYEKKGLFEGGAIVKSIVTGDLPKRIAKSYGVATFETLTGFKNICALANRWDETKEYTFLYGFEESIGYVYGDHVRDKDGVIAAMLIVEMAAYYKKQGKTLVDVLNELFIQYGYHKEFLKSLVLEGMDGAERIARMMAHFRAADYQAFGELGVTECVDFNEENPVGRSNVLKYYLDDGSWFAVRPSGTEPKIKLYIYVVDRDEAVAAKKVKALEDAVVAELESVK
ncbi:phospho-sugar mutase [Peptoniphilus equinus]|uniref:Phosphoglucomutase n=1 Tax=Peptoniphilus equinus TaxID=3016343 RepID=A0ABY7QTS7_9FIRM|nr:phospho-sugar mutase [Peptoniphilus equinus]WBW49680.1 phospho-sugar mutase [Peptoniphilus equinus]